MLTGLSIRDFVLVRSLDLDLGGGFSALTGETGAGKSILMSAFGFALGARAGQGLIRPGADAASVTASFDAEADHQPPFLRLDVYVGSTDLRGIVEHALQHLGHRRVFGAGAQSAEDED